VSFLVSITASFAQQTETQAHQSFITSKDGARIAVECTGKGPSLLIVHGGTGDRRRWQPLMPLFASHFYVCAMDRRGHGASERGENYSLQREFEDVAAVVNSLTRGTQSQPVTNSPIRERSTVDDGALGYARANEGRAANPVFVLGHSIGGVCAFEAAFLTKNIAKLVLYEPPLQDLDHTAVADRMEKMIQAGDREAALRTFLSEIVMVSAPGIEAMKNRPNWPERVAGIDIQIREIRALSKYRFDRNNARKLRTPTLLLTGGATASAELKLAIKSLMDTLPHRSLIIFEGQEHNAMDTIPQQFVQVVTKYLEARTRRINK